MARNKRDEMPEEISDARTKRIMRRADELRRLNDRSSLVRYEDHERYGYRLKYVNGHPISFQRFVETEKPRRVHSPKRVENKSSGDDRHPSEYRHSTSPRRR